MKKIENHCVDCGLPCLGNSCPNRNVIVHYCDAEDCLETAEYHTNGSDYCEKHAHEYFNAIFAEYSVFEKADMVEERVGFYT